MNTKFKFQTIPLVLILTLIPIFSADSLISAQAGADDNQKVQNAPLLGESHGNWN